MSIRAANIAIGILDCLGWAAAALAMFNSGSDPATKGFDIAAGWVVTLLLLATGVPALIFAYLGRAPRTALTLALAFPAVFLVLFVAVAIAFM